ncbi:hypothetical protein AKJ41_03535 [candidate division MSBL1 archaeon SCGC-AAA259O05]|uniref:Uncharacterized protein n=1 Tax=candidate division MSBL1 archaeon SCGC-AAA259O05 TaxID=1698271 RepID=A0A133V3A0_9EURY|nr:hypothetical protein AKJ41_03535 [candidate division MSBL1 archaeon SCGC-AAA259O05]
MKTGFNSGRLAGKPLLYSEIMEKCREQGVCPTTPSRMTIEKFWRPFFSGCDRSGRSVKRFLPC